MKAIAASSLRPITRSLITAGGERPTLAKSFTLEETAHGVRIKAILPGNIYMQSCRQFIESQGKNGIKTECNVESLQPIEPSSPPKRPARLHFPWQANRLPFLPK